MPASATTNRSIAHVAGQTALDEVEGVEEGGDEPEEEGGAEGVDGLRLNPGDLWFLIAMVSYAFYAALLRKRPQIHFLSFLAFTIIAGAIPRCR